MTVAGVDFSGSKTRDDFELACIKHARAISGKFSYNVIGDQINFATLIDVEFTGITETFDDLEKSENLSEAVLQSTEGVELSQLAPDVTPESKYNSHAVNVSDVHFQGFHHTLYKFIRNYVVMSSVTSILAHTRYRMVLLPTCPML